MKSWILLPALAGVLVFSCQKKGAGDPEPDFTNLFDPGKDTVQVVDTTNGTRDIIGPDAEVSDSLLITDSLETAAGLPVIRTDSAGRATFARIQVWGNLVSAGRGDVSEMGVVIGANANPVVSNNLKVPYAKQQTGSFSLMGDGLRPSTTYYARAYAVNEAGTRYGRNVQFRTAGEGVRWLADTILYYSQGTARTCIVRSDISYLRPGTQIISYGYVSGPSAWPRLGSAQADTLGRDPNNRLVLKTFNTTAGNYPSMGTHVRVWVRTSGGVVYGSDHVVRR